MRGRLYRRPAGSTSQTVPIALDSGMTQRLRKYRGLVNGVFCEGAQGIVASGRRGRWLGAWNKYHGNVEGGTTVCGIVGNENIEDFMQQQDFWTLKTRPSIFLEGKNLHEAV